MKYYLNNPLANGGLKIDIPGADLIDATTVDYPEFFAGLKEDDEVVLIGGDGTLNYLINHVDPADIKNRIYLYGNGSGNDFLNDIRKEPGKELLLNPYLAALPTVRVNGHTYRFINNMGLGIDGYVSEGSDKSREKHPDKKINYKGIALKGLLYDFKPYKVRLEVDGKRYAFDNVWMAPAMMGRFYGGGMMAAPGQDRGSGKLTVVIASCPSRLKVLAAFPAIFKGTHVDKEMIHIFTGNKIHVKFSRPCPGMIDGETIPNVTEYRAELKMPGGEDQ